MPRLPVFQELVSKALSISLERHERESASDTLYTSRTVIASVYYNRMSLTRGDRSIRFLGAAGETVYYIVSPCGTHGKRSRTSLQYGIVVNRFSAQAPPEY